MNPDRAKDLAVFLLGAAAMAAGGAPAGAMEVATGALGFLSRLSGARRTDADRILADVQREIEAAWRDWQARSEHRDPNALAGAVASFEEVVSLIAIRPSEVAASRLDADAIAPQVLRKAAEARPGLYAESPRNPDASLAREFLVTVVRHGYARLLAEPGFMDRIAPDLWRELFGQLDGIVAGVGEVKGDTATILSRLDKMTAILLRLLEERGEAKAARASGVTDEALIALASRIADDVVNVEQAMIELEAAVAVAVRVQEEGRHGSNLGAFVDAVFQRTAELSARGDYDAVTEELDRALADVDAEIRAKKARFLDRHIDNDRLCRDPAAAARHVLVRLSNDNQDEFAGIFAEFVRWREEGTRRGLNFDLEVDLRLGDTALRHAADPRDRANVQDQIGVIYEILGHRLSRRDLYELAHGHFQRAVAGFDRPDTRQEWIRTCHHALQNRAVVAALDGDAARLHDAAERMAELFQNAALHPELGASIQSARGTALVERGCLLGNKGSADEANGAFAEAISAYETALAMTSKADPPQRWASREQNLGRALLQAGRYEGAIERFERALVLKSKDRDVLSWGITIHNLAAAWGGVYQTNRNLPALAVARCHAGRALDVRTREVSPHEWAMTTQILGTIEDECFHQTEDDGALREAERLLRIAAPFLPTRQSESTLAGADRLAALIAQRRPSP